MGAVYSPQYNGGAVFGAQNSSASGVDDLIAQSVSTGAPTITQAALGQIHFLSAQSISTSAATITQAAFAQIHALTTQSISAGSPTISTPTLTAAAGFDNLTAQDIAVGVPTISTPGIAQIHFLSAQSISTSAPTITNAVLGPAGSEVWPTPDQVLSGITYGPTGADYTGTATAGSCPTAEDIAAKVLATLQASTIPANMVQVKGQPINGAGSEADPWGP